MRVSQKYQNYYSTTGYIHEHLNYDTAESIFDVIFCKKREKLVLNTIVKSVIVYGSETDKSTKKNEQNG